MIDRHVQFAPFRFDKQQLVLWLTRDTGKVKKALSVGIVGQRQRRELYAHSPHRNIIGPKDTAMQHHHRCRLYHKLSFHKWGEAFGAFAPGGNTQQKCRLWRHSQR